MAAAQESISEHIFAMLNDGYGREHIETSLLEKGHDEKFVKEIVQEARTLWYSKRRTRGLIYILIGAIICLSSCIITFTSTYSQGSFPYVLYGLTTLGILIVFMGLMMVF